MAIPKKYLDNRDTTNGKTSHLGLSNSFELGAFINKYLLASTTMSLANVLGIGSITDGTDLTISSGDTLLFAPESNYAVSVGASTTATTVGGALSLVAGLGATTGAGGAISFTAGQGGLTGTGGATIISSGAGGATSGNSGVVSIQSADETGSDLSGTVTIETGTTVSANSGAAVVATGNVTTAGNSGSVDLYSGTAVTGDSGYTWLASGNTSTGDSGITYLVTGDSGITGDSGALEIYSGSSAVGSSGTVNVVTGNTASGVAGDIILTTGTHTSTTVSPVISLNKAVIRKPLITSIAAGAAATGATALAMLGGNVALTGTTDTFQLPTTAEITTAIGSTPAGTTFNFSVNTIAMTAGNIATITAGANNVIHTGDLATITNTAGINVAHFTFTYITATTAIFFRVA